MIVPTVIPKLLDVPDIWFGMSGVSNAPTLARGALESHLSILICSLPLPRTTISADTVPDNTTDPDNLLIIPNNRLMVPNDPEVILAKPNNPTAKLTAVVLAVTNNTAVVLAVNILHLVHRIKMNINGDISSIISILKAKQA